MRYGGPSGAPVRPITLGVYADLFEDDLDGVADRMDQAILRAAEDSLRTEDASTVRPIRATSL